MKRTFLFWGVVVVSLLYFSLQAVAIDGFGQNTTGGAGGSVVTVTNAADLKTYAETIDVPYIIQVSGTIDLASVDGGKISIRSNKTIKGIGEKPTIIGSLAFKKNSSNVIIERLNITAPSSSYGEGDGISVKEIITNVFITKCTIYDCYDGCLDISRQSDWITVSWCKFYFSAMNSNNNRVSLIGNSDSATSDYGTLHITMHHNWFGDFCWQRIPSVRFGKVHIYNNYYTCANNLYGVWSRIKAECLIANNYFKNVNDPYSIHVEDEEPDEYGKIYASGNIFEDCTGTIDDGNDTVFEPTYSYIYDDAEDIPAIVQYGAGADGNDTTPPHWLFGHYGDFDRSGIVDINDMATFVGYWLEPDCNQLANADYDSDCNVNGYEFSLFAGNWHKKNIDLTIPAAPTGLWSASGDGTVMLDWDDNAENDLAGYNIYRSTTSGSGYGKINASLLTSSNYTDPAVVNGTTYYYVVTAVDTYPNESTYSSEVFATPGSGGETLSITLQENATGFCSVDGAIESEWAGYTGTGYANTTNATGKGVDWRISVPSGGTYSFIWRYASSSGDRTAKLIINDTTVVSSISFPASGAFTTYIETSAVEASLSAGINNIRLEATTSDGLGNIDYFKITGISPQASACQ